MTRTRAEAQAEGFCARRLGKKRGQTRRQQQGEADASSWAVEAVDCLPAPAAAELLPLRLAALPTEAPRLTAAAVAETLIGSPAAAAAADLRRREKDWRLLAASSAATPAIQSRPT